VSGRRFRTAETIAQRAPGAQAPSPPLDRAWRGLYGLRVSDRFREIYDHHADWFDRLVSREDRVGGLLPAVLQVCELDGARVIEFGAGTGRVTRLVAPRARLVHAFDGSLHMAQFSNRKRPANVRLGV